MNPKNIDRLFQEKLKNLEATPSKKVWSAIEGKLTNTKRGILPIWWFFSGIAALLILGIIVFPFSESSNALENNTEVITETPNNLDLDPTPKNNLEKLVLDKSNQQEILVAEDEVEKNIENKNDLERKENVVLANNTAKKKEAVPAKNTLKKTFLAANTGNKTVNISKKGAEDKEELISEKLEIYQKSKQNNRQVLRKNSASKKMGLNSSAENTYTLNNKKQQDSVRRASIFEKNLKPKKDFLARIKSAKETKKRKEKKIEKLWSLSPVVAILNSNSFSDTSPVNSDLSNSTTGNNTFSFGLQVSYKINDRWSVQSGVHQQKMSFQNSNITAVSVVSNKMSSAVFKEGSSFRFNSNEKVAAFRPSNTASLTDNVSSNASLTQEYGYIEIPLEIKYSLANSKKFDTQLVAGFSSLFLNANRLELSTNQFNEFGTVDNLNAVNFSGNFGVDFNYFLSTDWSLNLNPMFKTQLNTFSSDSNGFSPFNMGVYTGVKYTF